jgi:membrane-associated phospholipid phosphatase
MADFLVPFRHRIAVAVILIVTTCGVANAATTAPSDTTSDSAVASQSPNIGDTLWHDLGSLFTDGALILSAPAHFDADDWTRVAATAGTTVLLFPLDEPVRRRFMQFHSPTFDALGDAGNVFGVGIPSAIVFGGLYIGGIAFDAPRVRLAGLHVVESLIYAGLVTTAFKMLFGRARPYLDSGAFSFAGPTLKDAHNSLPSGHSTLAFALASTLSAEIDNPYATALLYSAATVTAFARVYVDRHWTSDVFLGAMIGSVVGYATVHLHDPSPEARTGWMVVPTINGVAVSYRF